MTLERAIATAALAHMGQTDLAGEPYIFHPLRVMMSLADPEDQLLAVLHDTIEDTYVTMHYLREIELTDAQAEVLELLTHRPDVPYMDYIKDIRSNAQATRIKLADLQDNINLERLPRVRQKDLDRTDKYFQAINLLVKEN